MHFLDKIENELLLRVLYFLTLKLIWLIKNISLIALFSNLRKKRVEYNICKYF